MENKEQNKKVYGMLLEIRDTFFLSVQYAESLEEAVSQAKLEFFRINKSKDNSVLLGLKVGLYTIKNAKDLVQEHITYNDKDLQKIVLKHQKVERQEQKEIKKPVEIKKVELSPIDVKNMIMREIVLKKDKKILEQHKDLFNENDIQYLTEKLESKTK